MATTTRKPILISGAGLASLLLAQSLLRNSIPFLIFERDTSISFRGQGYRLRLSAEGLDAIEADKCGKTGGGGFAALDAITGEKIALPGADSKDEKPADDKPKLPIESLSSRDGKIVGVSRGDMRKHFLEGCEPYIKWGHQVTGYQLTPTGVHALFADGSKSIEGKLKVYDTGARGIHGQAPTTAFKGLGEGVWRVADESNPKGRVFAITNVRPGDMGDPDVQFGWTMGAQPGVIKTPGDDYSLTGKPAADIAKELTANWHQSIRALFEQMNVSEAAFWKITCSTPSGVPEWENVPRVTVIGDAAHSMTLAGGIGANTAVRDSALLGRLLGEAGGYREVITEGYEREMRGYASVAVGMSYGMATSQFGVKIDENSKTV